MRGNSNEKKIYADNYGDIDGYFADDVVYGVFGEQIRINYGDQRFFPSRKDRDSSK